MTEETRLALRGYRDAMAYVLQLAEDDGFAYSAQLLKALHFEADLLEPRGQKRGRFYVARPELVRIRDAVGRRRVRRDDSDPFAG